MDLPEPQAQPPGLSRAPARGLKLMILTVVVFALLALYERWQLFQQPKIETVTILSKPDVSPTATPNDLNRP